LSLEKYIRNKAKKHFVWKGITIIQKDDFLNKISLKEILLRLEQTIPTHILKNLDSIYIGEFDFLKKREMQASYDAGNIYLSNEHVSESDACDDLVHEIGHAVEEAYTEIIYYDDSLEKEFISKRKSLWSLLKSEGINAPLTSFLETSYSFSFDNFLYKEIGYPMLSMLTVNYFYSPYAITSLREYFANGFEAFFYHKDVERLSKISPILLDKLKKILYLKEEDHRENV